MMATVLRSTRCSPPGCWESRTKPGAMTDEIPLQKKKKKTLPIAAVPDCDLCRCWTLWPNSDSGGSALTPTRNDGPAVSGCVGKSLLDGLFEPDEPRVAAWPPVSLVMRELEPEGDA